MQGSKTSKLKFDYIAFVAWLIAVTLLSLVPANMDTQPFIPHFDKLVHFVFYLGLSWLLGRLLKREPYFVGKVLIPTICYSILMEVLQEAMDLGRHFDIFDIIANIIGALIGTILIYRSVSG